MVDTVLILGNVVAPIVSGLFFLMMFIYIVVMKDLWILTFKSFAIFLLSFAVFLIGRPLQLLLGPHPMPLIINNIRLLLFSAFCAPAIVITAESFSEEKKVSKRKIYTAVGFGLGLGLTYGLFNSLGTPGAKEVFRFGKLIARDCVVPAMQPPLYAREITKLIQQIFAGIGFFCYASFRAFQIGSRIKNITERKRLMFFGSGTLFYAVATFIGVYVIKEQWWFYYAASVVTALLLMSSFMVEIKETAEEKAKYQELALYDGLTKVYVRRYFQIRLTEELNRASHHNRKCSLLMLDIDHFKKVNDTYGHRQGDIVLKEIGEILTFFSRISDIAARYGGEEFVMILPETDIQGALIIDERIRETVEGHHFPGQKSPLKITISAGAATFPDNAKSEDELIEKADSALYQAKRNGRNRVFQA